MPPQENRIMSADSIMLTFPGAQVLRQTPDVLRSLVANAASDQLDWQPAPDRWSISMVLAHLADVEVGGMMSRLRAIASDDNPHLPVYDQLELFRSGKKFDGRVELARFAKGRRNTLALLDAMPVSVGERPGRHAALGDITFNQLLHEFAFHDLGHIRQVIELYRSHTFYPHMGAFQSYYKIHP
jgi:hypothetical protein